MNANILIRGGEIATLVASIVYFFKENEKLKERISKLEDESSNNAKYVRLLEMKHSKIISHILNSTNKVKMPNKEIYEEEYSESSAYDDSEDFYDEKPQQRKIEEVKEEPSTDISEIMRRAKAMVQERESEIEEKSK